MSRGADTHSETVGRTETGITKANGINISYKIEGQGPPLLLISGLGADKSLWRSQTGPFRKYYRTVTFDNRGVGKSDKPPGPYTTRMMADDAAGLLDSLSIKKAHVVSVSMGGAIAQELAINHPEKVDKLVLGCTYDGESDEKSGTTLEGTRLVEAYEKSSKSKADMLRLQLAMLDLVLNKRSYRTFILPFMKLATRLTGKSPGGMAIPTGQMDAVETHNTADRLGNIKAPTLVICGARDRLIKPSSSDVIASLVPGAKLQKVPGGGHGFSMENKAEFNKAILDFLKG
jgi:pimeloyl-ACP methyl ester carboxylesterase